MDPTEPVLALEGVSRRFDDGTVALDGVNLDVDASTQVALVGPSGCGKTTLLRLASGLDRPTAGRVTTRTSKVAHVFQEPALLPWRSVVANVELPAELAGIDRAARRSAAREALESVGLGGAGDRLPTQLSVGMRMRVSLARSLTERPDLFLLDEPFAAVDEITREQLQDLCVELFADIGSAAVLVTHSVAEAVYFAHRVVVLSQGPGSVVAELEVPWAHPRHPDLRYDPEFASVCGAVHQALRTAMA